MKDELILSGNDIELVSKSAALINYQAPLSALKAPHPSAGLVLHLAVHACGRGCPEARSSLAEKWHCMRCIFHP